ncbi:MAG: cytochrome c3 family protein [Planctomycetota bacterium]|nr:cytochrome c3 family protein [Planctomycetota bacterium]
MSRSTPQHGVRHRTPVSAVRVTAAALCAVAFLIAGGCGNGASADDADGGDAGASANARGGEANPAIGAAALTQPAPRPTGPLPEGAACITDACHALFERAPHIHGAVAAGDCGVCHEPDQGGHIYPLRREGNRTCTFCHATGGHRMHRHAALEIGCAACHKPHVSEVKFLLTEPTVRGVCLQCHLPDDDPFPHGPFADGECTACHRPHESDHQKLLRGGEGNEHCFTCHAEMAHALETAPYVHDPAFGPCVDCHDPHASAHEYALWDSIEGTCDACHAEMRRMIAGAGVQHAAVTTADGCANCHDAHVAGRPLLLHDREDELCLQCHDVEVRAADGRRIPSMQTIIGERAFLHGPVRSGECSPCHNAHGADHTRLLRARFTDEFYAPFDLGDYALCFNCHESELVLAERTTTLTGFRDGDVNLHFIHVNRDRRGRTCRTCHELHGSNLPRHLAETVPFEGSGWAMPIGFRATGTGGACAPGCHEPQTYDRLDPSVPPGNAPSGGAP